MPISYLTSLQEEIDSLIATIDVTDDSLIDNYQRVVAIIIRMQSMHNDVANLEIAGHATNELKKFRTLVIDPTIERLEKVANYESRKLTATQLEWEMSGRIKT